jgi:rhodanese-related sulfurtransferase
MDGNHHPSSISRSQLYAKIGTPSAPIVVDVRRDADVKASDRLIVSATRQSPDTVELWARDLPRDRQIVLYCAHGSEISQTAAASLRALGFNAAHLERGFEDWLRIGLPTRRNVSALSGKWVTRERPKIDRIACPWLIRRFIDPSAQFLYVPTALVIETASQLNATPYDIEGVQFAHEGERCSFDTIIRIYDISDPPLHQLASIVRGADTSRHDLAPQCGGLFAISLGLSANFSDDHEMLAHGMVMYDALYTWCRSLQHETHNWPAKATAA